MTHRTLRRIAALAFAAAAVAASPAFAAKTLVYCSEGSPEGFNPQFFTTGTTLDASSVPIYNRLVEFELGTTNIVPGLAESWVASPDGTAYTFRLRKGVKFHSNAKFTPTRDFNADDVLFSYNRQADPNHPYAKVTPGQTYAYFEDMGMNDIVARVEKVDPMTVRFVLKKPEAPFMADMAMDFASILSAACEDVSSNLIKEQVVHAAARRPRDIHQNHTPYKRGFANVCETCTHVCHKLR
jgi:dipeptide transport system substrate-binding protein